uniref:ARAD1B16544p n=1 Tax=Blastobotrys adeninivorans TaxID=409370 RepID=A0A060T649_BLAAD
MPGHNTMVHRVDLTTRQQFRPDKRDPQHVPRHNTPAQSQPVDGKATVPATPDAHKGLQRLINDQHFIHNYPAYIPPKKIPGVIPK